MEPAARCFDKIPFRHHLAGLPDSIVPAAIAAKGEDANRDEWFEEELYVSGDLQCQPDSAASAGARPVPRFPEMKAEPGLCSTIPWATPARFKGKEGDGEDSKASHDALLEPSVQQSVVAKLHHSPGPQSLPVAPTLPALHQHQVMVWCQQEHAGGGVAHPSQASPSLPGEASSKARSRHDEEKFEAGIRRMVTRAELHRLSCEKELEEKKKPRK